MNEASLYKQLVEEQQKQKIFEKEGNDIYLIPIEWFNKWQKYTFSQEEVEKSDEMEMEEKDGEEENSENSFHKLYPGAIEIECLLMHMPHKQVLDPLEDQFYTNYPLKNGLQENKDFLMVGNDIANFFYSRYGGLKLKRFTVLNLETREINVELYLKRINFIPFPTICSGQDKDSLYTIFISKWVPLKDLQSKIKRVTENFPSLSPVWKRQYFKFLRLSPNHLKNYSICFEEYRKNYKQDTIFFDVKEIPISEEDNIEELQTSDVDILIVELSETRTFKINPIPKKKQDLKQEKEMIEEQKQTKFPEKRNGVQEKIAMEQEDNKQVGDVYPNGQIMITKIDLEHLKNMMSSFKIADTSKDFSGKRGLTGLQNLGNTCFMNSSLQCLSNVEELTTFMVNNQFVNDLNPGNPLGAKGHLAVSYANLMREMWQGSDSYASAHYLKKVIGKFAPQEYISFEYEKQFYGFSQQDSQELLSYLLDGIHEDLNRIKNKPSVETIDYSGGDDNKYSLDFFKNYKKRNDSVISDLMVGQFKSTVECPKCDKVSIIFDPYLALSVPIPSSQKQQVKDIKIKFYFIFKDYRRIPVGCTILIRSDLTIAEMKEIANENMNIPTNNILFTSIHQLKIERIIEDQKLVSSLEELKGEIFLFEVERSNIITKSIPMEIEQPPTENTPKVEETKENSIHEPIVLEDNQEDLRVDVEFLSTAQENMTLEGDDLKKIAMDRKSWTRVLMIKANASVQDLCLRVYRIFRPNLSIYKKLGIKPLIEQDIRIEENTDEDLRKEMENFFSLPNRLFLIVSDQCDHLINSTQQVHSLKNTVQSHKIVVKVILSTSIETKKLSLARCGEYQMDVPKQFTSNHLAQKNSSTLYDCIESFVKKEKLEVGNEWYCSKCKEHVLATKKMEIYTVPKILIIHLKRFKSGNLRNFGKHYYESGGKKINEHIEFPVTDLNLTQYVLFGHEKQQIYDLFAVSQHYGGMGGGHYTACAQNFLNKKWYNFNDSHVSPTTPDQAVSSAAYVLFYRRKD